MSELDQFKKNAGLAEAPGDYEEKARIEKVQSLNFYQAEKLIFEWVKTGVINVREFSGLCEANREAI